jgi:hypothetical protein
VAPVSLASAEDLSAGVPLVIQKGETTTMSDVTIGRCPTGC